MGRVKLMDYLCDRGCIRINNTLFSNGVGDGTFSLYYSTKLQEGFKYIDGVMFDLDEGNVFVSKYDCQNCYTPESLSGGKSFGRELGASAVRLAKNECGDFCLVKYL